MGVYYCGDQVTKIFDYVPDTVEYFVVGGPSQSNEAQRFKQSYPDVRCIGFEPSQAAYDFQMTHDFPGTLHKKGLGKEACQKMLRTWASEFTQMFIVDDKFEAHRADHPVKNEYMVDLVSLDSVLEEQPEIDNVVLWADIEMSEYDMLLGGREFFKRVLCLNVELCDWPENPSNNIENCQKLLDEYGFELANIWGKGRKDADGKFWRGDYIYVRKDLKG